MLYLFHWPLGKSALVSASTIHDVFQLVDSVGDPSLCTFEVFNTPFCLTFTPSEKVFITREQELEACMAVPESERTMSDYYKNLLEEGTFSDVTVVGPSETFQCHRAILAHGCSYFRAMFESGMREAADGRVDLTMFPQQVVRHVLQFLYTGRLDVARSGEAAPRPEAPVPKAPAPEATAPEDTKQQAIDKMNLLQDLLKAADFFDLPTLRDVCLYEVFVVCGTHREHGVLAPAAHMAQEHGLADLERWLVTQIEKCCSYDSVSEGGFDLYSRSMQNSVQEFRKNVLKKPPFAFGKVRELRQILSSDILSQCHKLQELIEELDVEALNNHCVIHQLCQEVCRASASLQPVELLLRVLEDLIDKDCDLDALNSERQSPLHIAASYFNVPLIELLCRKGARNLSVDGRSAVGEIDRSVSEEKFKCLMDPLLTGRDAEREISRCMERAARARRALQGALGDKQLQFLEVGHNKANCVVNPDFLKSEIEGKGREDLMRIEVTLTDNLPGSELGHELSRAMFPQLHKILPSLEILLPVLPGELISALPKVLMSELEQDWTAVVHKGHTFFSEEGYEKILQGLET